ncbi:PHB depolymerase family esterase [Ahrensia sp. R2A130]|uniref:alpha/beta hydrolase family esterase n=1 Tax=Ahrensia sp. R2A130 TaxID=744979 RepID=UPI0001E0AC7D|nr:polyhydroxybutyrate depolymerase [Ahrensia sp. R2A130]EFL89678.1 polyhydroxybutyrate depolymerase [Ahrensia sp. R2A130]
MTRFAFFLAAAFSLIIPSPASAETECGGDVMCEFEDRGYYVRAPDGWDGKTTLPVLLHFHGWGRQGKLIVNHSRIAGATRDRGVLLVAPNGRGRSWNFWRAETEDVGFANRVLADVAKRFPIDNRLYVSGYSYGSAMAWRYTCESGEKVTALLAISGTLRGPEDCTAPVQIRHVHGTTDTVMDYPFGPDRAVEGAVALWLDRNGCGPKADEIEPWQAVKILSFDRHIWNTCSSGKPVVLDVHPGGHFIPRYWIAAQLDQLMKNAPLPQTQLP